jgi:hypothetical protein
MIKSRIKPFVLFAAMLACNGAAFPAEIRVPASTAYLHPDPNGARVSEGRGISGWSESGQSVWWFGEFHQTGQVAASLELRLPNGRTSHLRLTIGGQTMEARAGGSDEPITVNFGKFTIAKTGYVKIELASLNAANQPAGDLEALMVSGPAAEGAHFNLEPRRNAASVHLNYPLPRGAKVALFCNEMIGLEDPVGTYYMACGFSRGYFGMQVNSPTERRIIFSVWDSGSGQDAKNRSTVSAENHVELVEKGEGVVATVFGNEGTGGHSHLVYSWKTGSVQRFAVAAQPSGADTSYAGYWFQPEQKRWILIASFRAPKDGKWLRGLYSFSENFNGANGHLRRKALFGPAWLRLEDGTWEEITAASFSHDPTGKTARLDRFMGIENGRFFLSHGGFVPGSTPAGERFTRSATGSPPTDLSLPR